jgi:polynucleotide 5'-hydroxyl-kinase GRC3/NOL9
MRAGEDLRAALDRAEAARVTLILGGCDTGKTSLAVALANALLARGRRVAVVDADLGQSEIGPPMTIGLGRVATPLSRLRDAEAIALHWVGSTSPCGGMEATVRGTRRLVERALGLGFERVLVDTSGLVEGEVGLALKRRKIDLVVPGLLLVLERAGECGPIVEPYLDRGSPLVHRLPASPAARRRPAEERRQHRERALARHLDSAGRVVVDLARVAGLRAGDDPARLEGMLVGLSDAGGDTVGVGRVVAVSPDSRGLIIDTRVGTAQIASVSLESPASLAGAAR